MNYWEECLSEAFDDTGIIATKKQIDTVASWVEGAHENYGMAHGYDHIPNPLILENEKLRKNLDIERRKEICPNCDGVGRIITRGPSHSSNSRCWKCSGEGKISP